MNTKKNLYILNDHNLKSKAIRNPFLYKDHCSRNISPSKNLPIKISSEIIMKDKKYFLKNKKYLSGRVNSESNIKESKDKRKTRNSSVNLKYSKAEKIMEKDNDKYYKIFYSVPGELSDNRNTKKINQSIEIKKTLFRKGAGGKKINDCDNKNMEICNSFNVSEPPKEPESVFKNKESIDKPLNLAFYELRNNEEGKSDNIYNNEELHEKNMEKDTGFGKEYDYVDIYSKNKKSKLERGGYGSDNYNNDISLFNTISRRFIVDNCSENRINGNIGFINNKENKKDDGLKSEINKKYYHIFSKRNGGALGDFINDFYMLNPKKV